MAPWAELARHEGLREEAELDLLRATLWAARWSVGPLADLGTFEKAEAWGVEPRVLVDDDHRRSRALARTLRDRAFAGLLAPSAALPGSVTLVVFRPRIRAAFDATPRLTAFVPADVAAIGRPKAGLTTSCATSATGTATSTPSAPVARPPPAPVARGEASRLDPPAGAYPKGRLRTRRSSVPAPGHRAYRRSRIRKIPAARGGTAEASLRRGTGSAMGVGRRIGGVARTVGWLAALGAGAMILWSFTATAARTPAENELGATWLSAGCVPAAPGDGASVALGRLGTRVLRVPDGGATYYQRIELAVDKLVLGDRWRSVRTTTRDTRRFGRADLPARSTSTVRAALGPVLVENGVLSLRATVTLKRVRRGPDATVWRHTLRTGTFTCTGGAGT